MSRSAHAGDALCVCVCARWFVWFGCLVGWFCDSFMWCAFMVWTNAFQICVPGMHRWHCGYGDAKAGYSSLNLYFGLALVPKFSSYSNPGTECQSAIQAGRETGRQPVSQSVSQLVSQSENKPHMVRYHLFGELMSALEADICKEG